MKQTLIQGQVVRRHPWHYKILVGGTLGAIASLSLAFCTPSNGYQVETTAAQIAPASFAVTSLQLAHNTGVAVVRLDGFNLYVSFEYESFEDSYGVPGSEYDTIEINSLAIDRITDDAGQAYSDFTDYSDVINIKNLIVAEVLQRDLVGV